MPHPFLSVTSLGLILIFLFGLLAPPGEVAFEEETFIFPHVTEIYCPSPLVLNRPATCRLILLNKDENNDFLAAVTVPDSQYNKPAAESVASMLPAENTPVWPLLPGDTVQIEVPFTPTKIEWVYQAFDLWMAPVKDVEVKDDDIDSDEGELVSQIEGEGEAEAEGGNGGNSEEQLEWHYVDRLYIQQRVWHKIPAVYIDTAHGNYPALDTSPPYFTPLKQDGLDIIASSQSWGDKSLPEGGIIWAELTPESVRYFQDDELQAVAGWLARGGNLIISVAGIVSEPATGYSAGVSFALEGINRILALLGAGSRYIPFPTASMELQPGLIPAKPPLKVNSGEEELPELLLENPVALLGAGDNTILAGVAAAAEANVTDYNGNNTVILGTMEQIGRGRLVLFGANMLSMSAAAGEFDEKRENRFFISALLHWLAEQSPVGQ